MTVFPKRPPRRIGGKVVALGVMSGIEEPLHHEDLRVYGGIRRKLKTIFVPHDLRAARKAIAKAAENDHVILLVHKGLAFSDFRNESREYQFNAFLDAVKAETDRSGAELSVVCFPMLFSEEQLWAYQELQRRLGANIVTFEELDRMLAEAGLPRVDGWSGWNMLNGATTCLRPAWSSLGTARGQLSAAVMRLCSMF